MEYLDFESPLKDLEDQLIECKLIGDKSEIDVSETCKKLMEKIKKTSAISHLPLIKQSRLSVMPIDYKSWKIICNMGNIKKI